MSTFFRSLGVKRLVLPLLVAAIVTGSMPAARATEIDFGRYAAVAYSQSTGKYGYAWNHYSRGIAEREALSMCVAEDAKVVGWVKGGWLSLVIGTELKYGVGWEYGDGAVNNDAIDRAVKQCKERGDKPKTVLIICSGDIAPKVLK